MRCLVFVFSKGWDYTQASLHILAKLLIKQKLKSVGQFLVRITALHSISFTLHWLKGRWSADRRPLILSG